MASWETRSRALAIATGEKSTRVARKPMLGQIARESSDSASQFQSGLGRSLPSQRFDLFGTMDVTPEGEGGAIGAIKIGALCGYGHDASMLPMRRRARRPYIVCYAYISI